MSAGRSWITTNGEIAIDPSPRHLRDGKPASNSAEKIDATGTDLRDV
jgi:hypothetical protein